MVFTDYDKMMLSTRLPLKVSKLFLQKHCENNKIEEDSLGICFSQHPEQIRESLIAKEEVEKRRL